MYKLPTKEEVEKLKAIHGPLKYFQSADKKAAAIFKAPSRKILKMAHANNGESNSITYNETLVNNCFVAGDEQMKTEDKYLLSVGPRLQEMVPMAELEIKDL